MEQNAILEALGQIARIVAETLELRDVVERVAKASETVLPMDHMAIARLERSGSLTLYSHTDEIQGIPDAIPFDDFSPGIRPRMDRVMRVDDLRAVLDPAFFLDRQMQSRDAHAMLTAPLRRGEQTVGFMSVESRRPGAFSAEHETIIQSIADIVGLSLEHERLWNLDMIRRKRLDSIDALLPIIANALDVREIFQQVSTVVSPVLPHDHLILLSISADEKVMHLDAYSGDFVESMPSSAPVTERRRFPLGQEYHMIHDLQELDQWSQEDKVMAEALGIGSVLRIPIYLEGIPESTLNFVSRTPHRYSEEDVPVARRVADLVSLALSHRRLAEEERRAAFLQQRVESLTEQLETTRGMRSIVGQSQKWKAVLAEVARVAPTETTVLLTGESGTGKEILARMVHRGSPRSKGPFVAINCAALPGTLLESELFGHEKGAFTGATKTHAGCVEQAAGGVLFLDEVGEMTPAVQAMVLRVIEQREFMRVGGTRPIHADVRLVAATNRDLKLALARGEFREDLYYRLRVFEISAPPLRERKEDIFPLAEAFLEEIAHAVGRSAGGLSGEVREALMAYPWPGNARELRNVIERATILCDGGLITLTHLPSEVAQRSGGPTIEPPSYTARAVNLEGSERALILAALSQSQNNRSKAARLLGIARSTLYCKIQKYGLAPVPDR